MSVSAELILLFNGAALDVVMQPKVYKVWSGLSARDRARVERAMKNHSAGERLNPEHFKYEMKASTGGSGSKDVPVFAFKGHQARVYGVPFTVPGTGRRKFVCSEIDPAKKQTKANQDCLKRAAQNVRQLVEEGWQP